MIVRNGDVFGQVTTPNQHERNLHAKEGKVS